jgi:NADH dehydrogenase
MAKETHEAKLARWAKGGKVGSEPIAAATVIWAAGVVASPVGQWLDEATDEAGRVVVRPDLSIKKDSTIFVIGDAASVTNEKGEPVPGIAPAAKQKGRFVADVIAKKIAGKPSSKAFHYRHAGHLATIGRKSAIIEFPRYKLKGRLAWWIWGIPTFIFLLVYPALW